MGLELPVGRVYLDTEDAHTREMSYMCLKSSDSPRAWWDYTNVMANQCPRLLHKTSAAIAHKFADRLHAILSEDADRPYMPEVKHIRAGEVGLFVIYNGVSVCFGTISIRIGAAHRIVTALYDDRIVERVDMDMYAIIFAQVSILFIYCLNMDTPIIIYYSQVAMNATIVAKMLCFYCPEGNLCCTCAYEGPFMLFTKCMAGSDISVRFEQNVDAAAAMYGGKRIGPDGLVAYILKDCSVSTIAQSLKDICASECTGDARHHADRTCVSYIYCIAIDPTIL